MNVTATTIVTSTVSAMPGPNDRKIDSRPTTSVSDPRATIRPAVKMIGRFSAVAACAAANRPSPAASRRRIAAMKKIA